MNKQECQELIDRLTQTVANVTFAKSAMGQTEVRVNITYFNQMEGIIMVPGKFDASFTAFGTDIENYITELVALKPTLPDAPSN